MTLVSAKSEGSSPQDTQNDPAFSLPASTPPHWPDFYQQPVENDIIDGTDWECDVFEEDTPLVLKHFLTDVEQDWVRNHYDIVCERFPGMLELTDDMIIVMFPTLMHQVMVVVVYNVIIAHKLGRQLYVKENVDYPIKGWGSKNLGLTIFAQNPKKDFKDLWPLFIFEIAYANSGQKCLRDLLKALLSIYHQGEIGGGIAAKVFKNTNGEITKVTYSLVSFILDGTQGRKETKHKDLESFQLYVKLPHTPKEKGIWIPSEGEHTDIGTKFRMYHNANDLGVR
ncbi:hypothetical protein EV421DRAFT_1911450 [Armillaria borealis]|uniref:Uncharacterized protein n=1 Tax=Armillaria borealis TaxID=47425 RepID=A0AA39IY96_9AGAR|nr:hypothetical protein EV421DRAFT_1911450 [Armillaria borealis]